MDTKQWTASLIILVFRKIQFVECERSKKFSTFEILDWLILIEWVYRREVYVFETMSVICPILSLLFILSEVGKKTYDNKQ